MKVLFLANWKIKKVDKVPNNLQPADYIVKGKKYWFFKYFPKDTDVKVIDISSNKYIEKFERDIIHLHIIQTLKALKELKEYDLIVSHGITSAILLDLFRRFFNKTKIPHIVFDIHSFNSASESGIKLKLVQYASKAIDGLIYHSSMQKEYYEKYFPWIVSKSKFIPYGTNIEFLKKSENDKIKENNFMISIGYNLRDNKTMIEAFLKANIKDMQLKIIGNVDEKVKVNNSKIEYVGVIPIDQLNQEIQKARICILPLEHKNYSFGQMTLLQQLYFGKALITGNVPSVIDYVENKKTALLYEANNVEDLKNKIIQITEDRELKKTLEKEAKVSVIEKFNERKMAERIKKFFSTIVENK